MKDTKYIVYEDENTGIEEMIIFAQTMQHYDVAHQLGVVDIVRGAGFVRVGTNKGILTAEAYGKSISLDIPSREKDTLILHRVLGFI